ncbi:mitogen-activated protein kinase-like protein [Leptomonas pyrrhocoris]|uniref:Mitogen-activated protein kinase-like protein n=1 Tax=Leptomonas pyrrhocoris TaxID=157538 RepID=A0A0M9G0K7_LEPPY|nr:mitogen-activated protein kinase-like protein [Leptomonas pyrrhocoris]KPA79960.1 mitogen-activated protein kinase-like protein [Leptomonas pyrrhocoris]|eukprot:XP_015658399.1 mitogen-activated protein kinase-like protein [Leptomonas pyrrhocoris]
MSAEQNPPDSNQRTFMDDNGILHSEQREDPVAASVRRTLRLVSRKNTIFVVSLVVLILVLTAAGGVSVAFVNKYYTTQSHREYMLAQNRVVLNSSVLMLQMYQRDLQAGAADLMKFMRASPASGHYQNVSALRDALKEPFLAAWRTWLLSSSITTTHSIFVPFCEESEINSGSCPIMALSIACLPYDMSRLCTFESSNDDGLQTSMYEITFRHGVPVISSFKGYGTINVGYRPSQTDSDRGFYLDPSYAAGVDSSEHPLLMLRRQEYLSFGDDTNRIVMCDSGSFLEQWFYRYEKSLQKSSDSYSVLFRDNGTILAYGYGDGAFMDSSDPVPCRFYTQDDASRQCGDSKAGVLDKIVDVFEASFPASEVLSSDTANNTFTLTKQMDEYSVAYQDFMRFRTDDANDIVFFAAYATRINSTLGRDGILQIVICVIIIFLCMFILGGVALVSMTQMMKVVQVISQLATHAAMYDTNKMREVLDQQNPGYLARTITSAATINDEFRRILANLNAYRPFLPQSLLAKGNFDFSEEGTDRAALTRKNSAFPNDSRDALDGENRHHYHRHHELRGAELFSPIADHEQRHILSNPIENRRLLQRGFHRTKSTVLVASLSNVAMDAADSVDVINKFVETVLEHAAHANGVVEAIEYQKIVVSFNSHFHVPRHQEKACLCALGMRESLQNSGCNVTIGISTGYNYVGTTGTEQQKARVMVGESVVVAHALATLQHILGCSIFASEAVVHEALVTTVMVDVVQLYYEYNHEWKQYNVSEIIGSRASVLSADMLLVKSVFALVRYRQAEAALLAVRAYVKESQDNNRPLPWPVQRLHALVEAQQTLIKNGYHRERRQWQSLEGVEVIANHLAEVNMLLVKQQQRQRHPLAISSNVTSGSFVCASQTGATTATDVAANTNDGFTRQDETQIARALMGEQSKATAAKRLVRPAQEVAHSEEDTMFAIFVPNNDDEESGDDTAAEEEEQNRSLPNTPATKAKPSERDAAVKADLPLSPLPPPAEQSRFSTPAMVATTAAAAYPSPSAPLSVEVEPALSVSGRLPSPAVQTHHAPLVHPVLTGLQSPTGGSSSVEGGTNRPNTDGSVYGGSGHGRAASFIDDGQLVCADSAWKGSADGSMGSSPHLRQHSSFELPQRIVSVEGQVFYRTSHQIGRGSFGAVYLVISETGYLGAMKTIPLNQSNASQLIHEVETLSQMRHENIVGYDCCAVQDEYFFIICEYMSAGTLGKLIQSLTSIPERAVRKYARDVLFGLCYLHQHSLVHCDIKPENILMLSDGTCKLADFGAASLSRSFAEATTMRGTARFSAPEAIMGVCSKAGDVYSFGITLAQMVTGVHPWHAYRESDAFFVVRYLGEIRHTLETGEPCAMQPDLPTSLEDKELETVIHCCCEFDPKKRPTVEELLSMLS